MATFASSTQALLQHAYPLPSPPPPPPPPLHSHSMPAPPMPSFQNQHSSTSTSQASPPPGLHSADGADRARAYKSRNKRPCDFCRYKKAACHLEAAPPCELCIRYGKECTFVESPAKRRRPTDSATDKEPNGNGAYKSARNGSHDHTPTFSNAGILDAQHELLPWENGINPFSVNSLPALNNGLHNHEFSFEQSIYQDPVGFHAFEPMSASTNSMHPNDHKYVNGYRPSSSFEHSTSPRSTSASLPIDLTLPFDSTTGEPSLDRQQSSNAQIVGLGGELDPYLLSRYRYDEHNEASFQSVRMRKMNSGPAEDQDTIPAFFVIQYNGLASKAQPQDKSDSTEKWQRELDELVPEETGKRLIHLFYKYVQPYFPVLSREGGLQDGKEPRDIPPCALAAIYGHALPFCAWDDRLCVDVFTPPSPDTLFKLSWLSCQPLLHTPTIAVLQTLLLLVQRRPTNRHVSDTPFKWVMMSTAVSIAQALGLNRDPTDWPIPSWEVKLRKRLAWAVFVQDKWLALNFGRSSHIQADDWDVPKLTEQDFPDADQHYDDEQFSDFSCQHFIKLCELTTIVDDILRELFSIKATRKLHTSLEATLEVAKPLRIRLTSWYQGLPAGLLPSQPGSGASSSGSPGSERRRSVQLELDGNGSLQLAYITAKIELFRAMLRPRITDSNAAAITALRTGALAVAKEISTFLDDLHARELEGFWTSYARTNFTIASSFMLLLFVTSPTISDAKECLALLNAWRSLLRIKSRSCDLLNLALLRLDGVFVAGMDKLIELSPAAEQAWKERREKNGTK
ncbi:hypothetical protein Slin15195_G038650 [Septoria linicola]|uniref:Zn(2)-C6 fungal-type domain-containing protein n=1 Tax=Septoria linicola TaxID=215465 RepID=A0A9Q9ATP2_9PEZI|nr:hypothetical protein Slin14017_G120060 [Septoria linicola]USW50546.1 hypothetical protein Slin15195_G038650 [Septoria linicola]